MDREYNILLPEPCKYLGLQAYTNRSSYKLFCDEVNQSQFLLAEAGYLAETCSVLEKVQGYL